MAKTLAPVNVAGVVLAAGLSKRFTSGTKQLVDWDGEPLVRRSARTALRSKLKQVLVVVGYEAEAVAAAVQGLDVELVYNQAFAEGQSTSIKAGLAQVPEHFDGSMFIPADQPFLSASLIDRLIDAYSQERALVTLPVSSSSTGQKRRGAPVLWDRFLWGRLRALSGDVGGRSLMADLDCLEVECEPRQLADLDTEKDLEALAKLSMKRS